MKNNKVTFHHNNSVLHLQGPQIIMNIPINYIGCSKDLLLWWGCRIHPHHNSKSFWPKLRWPLSSFINFSVLFTTLLGDVSTKHLTQTFDKSNTSESTRSPQSTAVLKQYNEDCDIGDGWRWPHWQRNTHFSRIHHTYSKMYYFHTSNSQYSDRYETRIQPIIISDHSAVPFAQLTKSHPPRLYQMEMQHITA